MSAKDILLEVAEKLPPDATLVDAIYELEFRQAVQQGLDELDRGEGILGLPQRVGARASGIITFIVLACGATIAFFGPGGVLSVAQWMGLGVNIVIAVLGVWLVAQRSPNQPPTRLAFQLIMVAALANVVMIAVAGTRILA